MKDTRYTLFGLQALSPRPTLPNGESRFIMAGGGMTSTLDDFAAFYQMSNGRTIAAPQPSEKSVSMMLRPRPGSNCLWLDHTAMITAWHFFSTDSIRVGGPEPLLTQDYLEPRLGSTKTMS